MTNVVVFLGPTLQVSEAKKILDAVYLPPVAMGDVYHALKRQPRAIGIIDGYFDQVPAVWHKEILVALESGVPVLGASSMGALRAAELAPLGMQGVGTIFEWFRSGKLEDDDEVTVAHSSADLGYRPLSDAMVNIRHGLLQAHAGGIITLATRDAFLVAAKGTFYAERSWDALAQSAPSLGIPSEQAQALRAFVRATKPNLKRDDAIALLEQLRDAAERGTLVAPKVPRVERNRFWDMMVESVERPADEGATGGTIAFDAVREHVRAMRADLDDIRRGCLLSILAKREASRLGITVDPQRLQKAVDSFRRSRGLAAEGATREWMAENRMDQKELVALVERDVGVQDLLGQYAAEVDSSMIAELRRRGLFAPVYGRLEERERRLGAAGRNPTIEDAGIDFVGLFDWYEQKVQKIDRDVEHHAGALRCASTRSFVSEVIAEYMLEKSGHEARD